MKKKYQRHLGSLLGRGEVDCKLDHTKESKQRATGTKDNANLGECICFSFDKYFSDSKNICFYFEKSHQMTIEAWRLYQSQRYFNNCRGQAYEQQDRYEDSAKRKS